MTLGFVGIHGETIIGMQGIGISTPKAAAVAAATAGFVMVIHIPKGLIFTNGIKSLIVATGKPETNTELFGSVESTDGAIPNEHLKQAPQTTTDILCRTIQPTHVYIMSFCYDSDNILLDLQNENFILVLYRQKLITDAQIFGTTSCFSIFWCEC